MNPSNARPHNNAESRRESLVRAQMLLQEALQHLDDYAEAPELGARLDEILARLGARLTEPLDQYFGEVTPIPEPSARSVEG